jgi:rfaE bifunctional protein kinase chain/domain/rfaE bifunctional protein nucleotidyltransferase chain/domain
MSNQSENHLHHLGFSSDVTRKIVPANELQSQVGTFPRQTRLVMAHGTFDLVHPGHLRHLAYAKSLGDLLVVSITSDEHVMKANMRPYVPQELRALNLAALQLVDYVVVDGYAEPIQLISQLQPEIFVKGYEYEADGHPPRTLAEKQCVEQYGGRMVFTPGDLVLSSSAVIENDPPNIGLEKLLTLMGVEGLAFKDLFQGLSDAAQLKILVVGDLIVDGLTNVSVIGGHRKTPTPSVRIESRERFVGGAGVVAKHMAATGAKVTFLTIAGDDEVFNFARSDLEAAGVELRVINSPERPTTFKDAIVSDGYRLLRVDNVDNSIISDAVQNRMLDEVRKFDGDAVIFSDFRHGIFNRSTIEGFVSAPKPGIFKVADSQVASRWGNILDFYGCNLVTPNEQEVRFALADQDTVIRPLGSHLYDQMNCETLILKLGARGCLVFRDPRNEAERRSFFAIDGIVRQPVLDPVGAGDALLAYSTVSHLLTGNEVVASIIGTIAAGLECEYEGNIQITTDRVTERLHQLEKEASMTP